MTSPIHLNTDLSFAPRVSGGIPLETYQKVIPEALQAFDAVLSRVASGELGFWDLPLRDADALKEEKTLVAALSKDVDHLVVLGIGGSSLGGRTIQSALMDETQRQRVSFIDNVDPFDFEQRLNGFDLSKTAFNIISKSGGTIETASQFVIVRDRLKKELGIDGYRARVILTTDPQQGALCELAQKEGLRTLPIPNNVGGRFSVLTSVGTFPALFAGVPVDALLRGAALMREACSHRDIDKNPALKSAVLHFLADTHCERPIHVMMPYSSRLWELSLWFVQLWGESLGKKVSDEHGNVSAIGPTPVPALGSTDQHSQLQLFMEGPHDKFVTFIGVEDHGATLPFPEDLPDAYGYLAGHSMAQLMKAEEQGTTWALAQAGRPSQTLTLSKVSPESLGALFFLFEAQTAFSGGLYGINAFDQPGVEAGKKIAYGLMGRAGYEAHVPEALRNN
jgi:glucose-6-phosphate isomerase